MYSTRNGFSRQMQQQPNLTYPPPTYTSSNCFSPQNHPMQSTQTIGSKRVNYVWDQLPAGISQTIIQWKENIPMSIVCRPQTLHLTPTQLRLQDYYLIRSKQIGTIAQEKLAQALKFGSFNEELLGIGPRELFSYTQENCVDLDAIRSGKANSNPAITYNNSSNNNLTNNTNSGMFSRPTNSSNIFAGNQNNSNNTSPFSSNKNVNSAAGPRGNIFNNNRNTTNPNIFNNAPSNSPSNNVFSANSNNSAATYNNQTSGSIYNNQTSGGTYNNQTSGGTYNNQTSGGNYSNHGSGGGNNTNILASNSNSSNNFNNLNRGTNVQNTGNNLFSNNQSTYSGGNNNYPNQTANTGFNHLFKPSNQTNLPKVDFHLMLNLVQNYVQTNQVYMQQMVEENQSKGPPKGPIELKAPDVWQQLINRQKNSSFLKRFEERQIRWQLSMKKKDEQYMIIVPRCPKEIKRLRTQSYQEDNIYYNYPPSSLSKTINNEVTKSISPLPRHEIRNKSVRMTNHLPNRSMRLTNYPKDQYGSMIYSRCDLTLRQTKARDYRIVFDSPCKCALEVEVLWQEFQNNPKPRKTKLESSVNNNPKALKTKLESSVNNNPKALKIKLESPINKFVQIQLPSIDLQSEEGRKDFEYEVKQKCSFIRKDGSLSIDRRKCQIDSANSRVKIVCKVQQKIVNLSLQEYEVYYSRIDDKNIYDLTISRNKLGTIVWVQPIPYESLDFKRHDRFLIDDCEAECEIPELKDQYRVTFHTLPEQIEKVMKSKGLEQARCNLKKLLKQTYPSVQFSELWESGTWSFRSKKEN